MGQKRLNLDAMLRELFPDAHIYYQPPPSVLMEYPAIRYRRTAIDVDYADNVPYFLHYGYELTVIDRNPDSAIVDGIAKLPKCRHNRHYTADNLNHDVFIIYE